MCCWVALSPLKVYDTNMSRGGMLGGVNMAGDLGGVRLAKFNEMGGRAAQGIGYGMAYAFQ